MISSHCKKLVSQGGKFKPVYDEGLSNHLSMVLIALDSVGASEEQMTRYYLKTIKKLNLRISGINNKVAFSRGNLGNKDKFEEYYNYLKTRLNEASLDVLLSEVLPVLIEGIVGGAFHPLIRFSYALKSGLSSEIILSLAYWATEFLPLNNTQEQSKDDVENVRISLNKLAINHSLLPNITLRIKAVNTKLLKTKSRVQPSRLTFEKIREFCIKEFSCHNNFIMLHTLTACYAYQDILTYIEGDKKSLTFFWEAILVAMLSTGIKSKKVKMKSDLTEVSWNVILNEVKNCSDEHQIKLIYMCWKEYQNCSSIWYNFIAQRALNKNLVILKEG